MPVMICQPFRFFTGLPFILEPGKEDADIIDIVFEVRGFVVFDEHDLPFGTEVMLFALSRHVPLALFFCRSCILVLVPENAHADSSRLLIIHLRDDKMPVETHTLGHAGLPFGKD
jgi:hypothetical protein